MTGYITRRLLIAIPVLAGVLVVSFVLVRLLPGDPVRAMMSPAEASAGPEFVEQRRAELGIDKPLIVQFGAWAREVAQGNLGYSYHQRRPVTEMIGARVGPTLLLTSTGFGLALLLGVPIGVFAALRQNGLFDYGSAVASMAAISVPNFFLGLVAISVFALWLGVLPTGGMRTLTSPELSLGDTFRHLILPAGVLSVNLMGPYVRYTRQGMLEVLNQEYMTTARAKGAPRSLVVVRHGLRNAIIPLTTVLGLQLPVLFSGVLIIEVLFSWPGIGRLAYTSVIGRDYPVVLAIVMVSGVLVLLFNLFADVVAAMLDPRIRL